MKSTESAPQNTSPSTTKLGTPKTPRAAACSVFFLRESLIALSARRGSPRFHPLHERANNYRLVPSPPVSHNATIIRFVRDCPIPLPHASPHLTNSAQN